MERKSTVKFKHIELEVEYETYPVIAGDYEHDSEGGEFKINAIWHNGGDIYELFTDKMENELAEQIIRIEGLAF